MNVIFIVIVDVQYFIWVGFCYFVLQDGCFQVIGEVSDEDDLC